MQVIVLNYSGNVGKTTVSRHLLQPRLKGAEFYTFESVNADDYSDDEVTTLRGKQLDTLMPTLLGAGSGNDLVVDVGASNAEVFVQRFSTYKSAHEFIDFFVIPVTPDPKQLKDTKLTIETLEALGVPAEKIRVVMNKSDAELSAEEDFSNLFKYHRDHKSFVLNKAARITNNELFPMLIGTQVTIPELLEQSIADFKAKIRAAKDAKDSKQQTVLAQQLGARLLAATVSEQLDAVFAVLFK
jgi:hypothetical protein